MKKILVVDDDVDILMLVKITLSMNNFMVEAISRWEEIDQRIKSFGPDLILLDVMLVGADGRGICKRLKQSEDTKDIPVILFSANAEMGNSLETCGAQGFIAKPYELAHLLETINQLA
jgi:DNA-binding response OmpR family regulator